MLHLLLSVWITMILVRIHHERNGIMYINENALDENNLEETIIKHEVVHAISDTDSPAYKAIEQEVDKLIQRLLMVI